MTEENILSDIILEAINDTIKPLDLVVTYILWKEGGEIEESVLDKELGSFIESITPKVLEEMIDELIERGLLKQNENGNIIIGK